MVVFVGMIITLFIAYKDIGSVFAAKFILYYLIFLILFIIYIVTVTIINFRKINKKDKRKRFFFKSILKSLLNSLCFRNIQIKKAWYQILNACCVYTFEFYTQQILLLFTTLLQHLDIYFLITNLRCTFTFCCFERRATAA